MTSTYIKDILLAEAKQYLDYYVESDNRVFAGYLAKDRTGQYYQYLSIRNRQIKEGYLKW